MATGHPVAPATGLIYPGPDQMFSSQFVPCYAKHYTVLRENTACSAIIACLATIRQRFHPYKLLTSWPLNMIPCYHICFWSYRTEYVTMTFSVSLSFHPSVQLYTLIPMTQLYWLTLQSRLLTDFPQICPHASPSSLCPTVYAFIHLFTKFCFKKSKYY